MNHIKKEKNPLNYLQSHEVTYFPIYNLLNNEDFNDKKILEVGSGLGYLTFALKKSGYDVKGIDISKQAVENSTKRFGDFFIVGDVTNYCKNHKNEYDLIVMNEVIEHLENPKFFIRCLKSMLVSGGKLLITTPNSSFNDNHSIWEGDLPPIHLWNFNKRSMEYIGDSLKLNLNFVNFKEYNSKYPVYKNNLIPIYESVLDRNGNTFYSLNYGCKLGSYLYELYLKNNLIGTWLTKLFSSFINRKYCRYFGSESPCLGVIFEKY
ncbi:MAG: class I SAM-dependent methyltransferase [Methanobrevibacter sp.]|jgi:SAM-dependent methyltransferase|nr:class I SAM-dependent methyltransferase [Candidatus Methanoflexus mossambicus]